MANPYFSFKQFTIFHDRCAMKVGTDAVLLGAWVSLASEPLRILDIGTGCGLLALMLAQRTEPSGAQIDAVEIDASACEQAQENILASPWKDHLSIFNSAIQSFTEKQYDLILSNPPFFVDSTKSSLQAKATARHTDLLSQEELLFAFSRLLAPKGSFAVVYPTQEALQFRKRATKAGYFCTRELYISGREGKPTCRILSQWSKEKPVSCDAQSWAIEQDKRHVYSEEYKALTKDFYLKF